MGYTHDEWVSLPPREKQSAVEGLAKSRGLKAGKRVLLDSALIGTDIKEAVIARVRPNTSYDDAEKQKGDMNTVYPDARMNLVIVVESDSGMILEVNIDEILKVYNY